MEVKPGYKLTEVGVIPEDWSIRSGEEITTFIGKGASPRWQGFEYTNDGMLFVTSENVRDGFLEIRDPKYLPLAFHEKLKRTKLRTHDLLINLVGASIGRSCQIRQELGEANVNQAVAVFRVKEEHCSGFVARYFQALTTVERILEMQVDAARPNISLTDLRRFLVPLPTKTEQEAIAEALSDADALIESLEKLLAKKRHIKQGAMQELLTGKKRLPGFSSKWQAKHLGDCGEVIMGQSPPGLSYNRSGAGSPLINGQTEFTDRHPTKIQWTTQPARFCKPGDLLICVRGNSTGRTNYANDTYAIGRGVAAIRAKADNDTLYISYQVICAVSEILAAATGSTFPSVDGASFRKIVVPLPSPTEQRAIAGIISDIDAEIEALETKLAKARQIKQGMMQELLTGRIRLI